MVDVFVTALGGTELALREELRELGYRGAKADRGGVRVPVHGGRELEVAFHLCLWTRIGVRVLVPVGECDACDAETLYEGVRAMLWERHLDPTTTIAVSGAVRDAVDDSQRFLHLKVKDAVVDRLRERFGARPDVDRERADAPIFFHLSRGRARLFLDASGGSLHRRGYRVLCSRAPLKETLAAAVLRLSGWDRASPLIDPFCGAGTLPIEADLWARRIAPGLSRDQFAVERWRSVDEALRRRFFEIRRAARNEAQTQGPEVCGSDIDRAAIDAARDNARRARSRTRLLTRPLSAIEDGAGTAGTIVANLPYGERIAIGRDLLDDLADAMRRLGRWRWALLVGAQMSLHEMPCRASRSHRLWNGPIACRLDVFEPRR